MVKVNQLAQLNKTIDQLSPRQKIRLLNRLQRDTWKQRFQELLARVDARVRKAPISQRDVNRIVEQAKKEFHANRRR